MMTSTPPLRALSLIFGASLFGATSVLADPNAPCYFPGGALAPGYFACHAFGAEVSSCCAPGWTCFSNSLCIATTETRSWPNITLGAVQRGACTAPKWNNEFCGSVCLSEFASSYYILIGISCLTPTSSWRKCRRPPSSLRERPILLLVRFRGRKM